MITSTLRALALLPALLAVPAFATSTSSLPGDKGNLLVKAGAVHEAPNGYLFNAKVLKHERGGGRSVANWIMLVGRTGVPASHFSGNIQTYISGTHERVKDPVDTVDAEMAIALDAAPATTPTQTFDSAFSALAEGAPAPANLMQALDPREPQTAITTDSIKVGDTLTITALGVDSKGAVYAHIAFNETKLVSMRNFMGEGELKAQLPTTTVQFAEQTVRIPRNKAVTIPVGSVDLEVRAEVEPAAASDATSDAQ